MVRKHSLSATRHLRSALGTALLWPCIAFGCSDGVQNVGTTGDASGAIGGSDRYASANALQFVGHWIGEADDALASGAPQPFRFASGSTRLELNLDFTQTALSSGLSLGGLRFGEAEPPPVATDPNVGYPAGVDYLRMPRGYPSTKLPPFEGFTHSIYPASYSVTLDEFNAASGGELPDGVFRLAYSTYQLFHDWCALQDPLPAGAALDPTCKAGATGVGGVDANGNFSCQLEFRAAENVITASQPIDCNQMELCLGFVVCACDQQSCQEASRSNQSELWLRPSADGLEGVFVNATFLNDQGLPASPSSVHFRLAD